MLGHLPLMCFHQSMARGDCSLLHHSNLEGDNCDVESSVLSPDVQAGMNRSALNKLSGNKLLSVEFLDAL